MRSVPFLIAVFLHNKAPFLCIAFAKLTIYNIHENTFIICQYTYFNKKDTGEIMYEITAHVQNRRTAALRRMAALAAALAFFLIPSSCFATEIDAVPILDIQSSPVDIPMDVVVDVPLESPADDKPWEVLNGIPQTREPLGLPECERVDDTYFNYTVFVGDSVTLKLDKYVTAARKENPSLLGGAKFIAIGSLGSHSALESVSKESLHPTIGGKKMPIEDALATMKAQKVYIMLGMNDVALCGQETSIEYMLELITRIRQKSPGIEIFIQSATPRYGGGRPTSQMLFDYDLRLYEEILNLNDPKIHFVDVAFVMRDESGNLYESYCSDKADMGIHFTDIACERWIDYLYTHAAV